jgi:hypothetical protein
MAMLAVQPLDDLHGHAIAPINPPDANHGEKNVTLFRRIKKRRESMSVGMILLALWLILQGLPLIVRFVIPNKVMGILALLAGILILIGR